MILACLLEDSALLAKSQLLITSLEFVACVSATIAIGRLVCIHSP